MLRKEFRRKEISRRLSRRLGFVLTVELAAGLLLSIGVIALFAEIVEEVVEGESHRFDEAVCSGSTRISRTGLTDRCSFSPL